MAENVNNNSENAQNNGNSENKEVTAVVDCRIDLTVDSGGKSVNLTVHPPINGGKEATVQMVKEELKKQNIVFGVDDKIVKKVVEERLFGIPTCIAEYKPPKKGANGYISFRFDKEHKLKPVQDEFGIADYRELNSIVPIRKNEVVADIVQPEEGTPGKNVFGQEIPGEAGVPAKISLGRNTLVTTDGKNIVSACDGHIVFAGGCFHVEQAVTIKTDLDISVGNISFFGDVHIKGNVMEGFSVNAGKNVKIDGSVFGGEISAGGNLSIVGGCINSKVNCNGDADIGFCENSEIFVKGDISSKQFAFCNVFCYGKLTAKGPRGVIAGGKITSMHDITAGTIGSEKYTPTEVNIGDGSVLFARRREAESDLSEATRIYDLSIKNLAFLKNRKNMQGGVLYDEQQRQQRIEMQNKLFYAMRKTELEELIAKLDEDIKDRDNLSAVCNGVIYPGVKFCINFLTLDVTEAAKHSRVTIVNDVLTILPM